MKNIKVKNLKHLKELCNKGNNDFFISLKGVLTSQKNIDYDAKEKMFYLFQSISGEYDHLTSEQFRKTNILKAIKQGALYCEL